MTNMNVMITYGLGGCSPTFSQKLQPAIYNIICRDIVFHTRGGTAQIMDTDVCRIALTLYTLGFNEEDEYEYNYWFIVLSVIVLRRFH